MADRKEPNPRGRGALIAAALKKKQERERELQEAAGGSGDATLAQEEEPPKPRGRAALLKSLIRAQTQKVGATPAQPDLTTASAAEVTKLTETVSKLTVTEEKSPCDYIGTSGKHLPASANYIKLKLAPNQGVFEYEVIFKPEIDSTKARYTVLNGIIREKCKVQSFDGHVLYLPNRLIETRETFDCVHPYDNTPVQMTVVYKKQRKLDDCLQHFNVLFNKIMRILQYKRVGRDYFDNQKPYMIPQHKLEIWPGYATAVHEYSGGLMLCLDIQHRVLRTQNALQFIYETTQLNKQRFKQVVEKALIGASILTRYNNNAYIIHDINWEANPTTTFETSKGETTFIDYYQKQYDLKIRDQSQPLLINRQTVDNPQKTGKEERLIALIPELCYLTGLTDEMRADFRIMKDVAAFTRVTPNQRMDSLRKYMANINNTPEAKNLLAAWGLSIDCATIDLQMRVLDPETIYFRGDTTVHGQANADWTSAAMKNHVMTAVDFNSWIIIHTQQDRRNMDEFLQCLRRLAPRMGINIQKPIVCCLEDDRNETYMKTLQQKIHQDVQIVVIICPTNRDDRYSAIKKICCAKMPVPSQVINSRTLRDPKKLPAITQKIALQMNCKLGGSLWSVRFPCKKWMICGIDVFHTKSVGTQAVCGLVSSTNDYMTRYFSNFKFHKENREIADHLKTLFRRAFQEYLAENGYYPVQVVVYRDGVGDGQLAACQNLEIPQIRSVIDEICGDTKLIYIVVQKRINTRIFGMMRDGAENPPPGSIVDTSVTRKYLYDFFLVAQQVRQGTVTPTHYIVLNDDSNHSADKIQRLSYKLCHMYYNWTGTVRVPAPCQYAHKLAYLIGQNVRMEVGNNLMNKLFYL